MNYFRTYKNETRFFAFKIASYKEPYWHHMDDSGFKRIVFIGVIKLHKKEPYRICYGHQVIIGPVCISWGGVKKREINR